MTEITPRADCCGCKMCGDICPKEAITFPADNEGFWYPKIDTMKCINCELCKKRCPVNNETVNPVSFEPDVYCSWILDEEARFNSTSGGVYSAFARTIMESDGALVSCMWDDGFRSCYHTIGHNEDDLKKLRRSKYLQSDMAGIYNAVKKELDAGKEVLFCGSPCYNSAMLEYLGGNNDRLFLIDYICHGINSPKAFDSYIDELEKRYKSKVAMFHFKNKERGWTRLGTKITFANGKSIYTWRPDSPWLRGYIYGELYTRPSCERCRFKKIPRVGDITLGDFWGIQHSASAMRKGVSVVCVNTEKGRRFYERTLPQLHSEHEMLKHAVAGNKFFLKCVEPDQQKRAEFFRRINDGDDFSKVVFSINKQSQIWIIFKWYLGWGKNTLKRWLRL